MTFDIRRISHTADGREIVRSSRVEKTQLRVGRAAESDIHLQDLAVELDHARIEAPGPHIVAVRATGTLGFDLDGKRVLSAEIDPALGAELRFGGHRIMVSSGEEAAIALTVQRVDAVSEASEEKDEARSFSLAGTMIGKRPLAWGLALFVLIAFLAVPILSYSMRPGEDRRNIYAVMKEKNVTRDAVFGDASWSSGPLSRAHHALEGKCESCHSQAFVSVRDTACKTCHETVHDHAPIDRIRIARGDPGLGGRMLAGIGQMFGRPGPGACVDCHAEHEGAGPMEPAAQAFCTDCHATMSDRLVDTKLGDAGDFGTAHPEFRPLVMTAPGKHPRFDRVSLAKKPRDESGLKFPHALHLSKTGGVAQMARRLSGDHGFGEALACKDCHRPSSDGVRFRPVDMKRDCQMCHSLGFETVGGITRTLRHGEPDQVIADLRAYYRSTGPAVPVELGGRTRRRPGDYAAGQVYHAYFGAVAARPDSADAAIAAVFSEGGACYDCHTIMAPGAKGNANWDVVPVHQTGRFLTKGWFDHKAHDTERCESCHVASASSKASDLLIPDLKSCRTCHGGEKSDADVPSGCALCHSYHDGEGAPWVSSATFALNKKGDGS